MYLVIDTSGPFCSALFWQDGAVVARRMDNIGRGHAEHLMVMLDEMRVAANKSWHDITALGCVTGPGSFTGLRVGLAAARGLALALKCPCIGVRVFDAYSYNVAGDHAVVLDAKRNQYWLQVCSKHGQKQEPVAVAKEDIMQHLAQGQHHNITQVIGSGAQEVAQNHPQIKALTCDISPAIEDVAAVVVARIKNQELSKAEPFYLRAADAKPQKQSNILAHTQGAGL